MLPKHWFLVLTVTSALAGLAVWWMGYATHLPEERPKDLRIIYDYSTGRSANPISSTLELSEEGGSNVTISNTSTKVLFAVTTKELDDLYRLLRRERFDKLHERAEVVYDGGGASITLSWGSISINKGDDGARQIAPEDRATFDRLSQALTRFAQTKIAEGRR